MVAAAVKELDLAALDLLIIENVGNLVCPAIYDLGQEANVVALAVTEGEDKPLKYPVMFHKADLVVLTKVDLVDDELTLVVTRTFSKTWSMAAAPGRGWPPAHGDPGPVLRTAVPGTWCSAPAVAAAAWPGRGTPDRSPMARLAASRIAPTIPGNAAGSTTWRTVSDCVAPRP